MRRRTRRRKLRPGQDIPLPPPYPPPESWEEWLESRPDTQQNTPSFDDYHRRHLGEALALQGRVVLVAGAGATGSLVATQAARSGFDMSLLDREPLEIENVHRNEADAKFIGENKASAVAKTLRAELPAEQTIRSANVDLEKISDSQFVELIRSVSPGVSVIVGATGNDAVDRRLNSICQRTGVPFIVPGLYRADHSTLGEIQIIPSDTPGGHACFECLHPTRPRARPLEAQEVPAEDVAVLARETIKVVKALILPEAGAGPLYADRLSHSRSYLLVDRGSMQVRAVATSRRPGCQGCLVPLPSTTSTRRRSRRVDPGRLQQPATPGRGRQAVNSRRWRWLNVGGLVSFFGWIWSWRDRFNHRPLLKTTIAVLSALLTIGTLGLIGFAIVATVTWVVSILIALVKAVLTAVAIVGLALFGLWAAADLLFGEG